MDATPLVTRNLPWLDPGEFAALDAALRAVLAAQSLPDQPTEDLRTTVAAERIGRRRRDAAGRLADLCAGRS